MNVGKYRAMISEATEEPNNMSRDWVELMEDFAFLLGEREAQDKDKEVMQCALQTYGGERQKKKLFEEMAELTEAICKTDDGRDTKWHIAEEIADVRLLLEQMVFLYGIHGEVRRQHKLKIQRLNDRVNGGSDEKFVS